MIQKEIRTCRKWPRLKYVPRKVDVPKSITTITWTPIFKCYVVRCGSKNWQQKDMWLKEIELCAQNMLTILSLIVNMIGRTCMTTKRARESSLSEWLRYSFQLQHLRGTWLRARFQFASHLALIFRFISYQKGVQSEKYPSKAHAPYILSPIYNCIWLSFHFLFVTGGVKYG